MRNELRYHTRLIPKSHLNLATPTAKTVVMNRLCDTAEPATAQALDEYGIDIVETRLVWWELEPKKGVFDFSRIEEEIQKIKSTKMKVGLFPWLQHPPKWVLENSGYTRLRCLTHNTESTLISLWDERLLEEYDRLYEAIAKRLKGEIDFLYVGVYGDYGELFFPNGVEHYLFSPPNNHTCLWCGDEKAKASYARFLNEKYGTPDAMNRAWKTEDLTFETAMSFSQKDSFLKKWDFATWYTSSMMDFADRVCAIARKHFPTIPAALPIGHVHEPLAVGQIKSLAAKLAAKYRLTARWTGWAYLGTFEQSNICARRIASAAKFYGADFGVEAALFLSKEVAPHALFEAISNGASMIHNDPGNILRALETYQIYKNMNRAEPYVCKTAIFYPIEGEQCGLVDMDRFFQTIAPLRRRFDYELVDSHMIRDGILTQLNRLIFVENTPLRSETEKLLREAVNTTGLTLECLGAELPFIVDDPDERRLICRPFEEEIPQKNFLYTTEFEGHTVRFDPISGSIETKATERKQL